MNKLQNFTLWKIFLSIAQTQSLSETSEELDVEVSTISRALSTLEEALGQQLIVRKTRPIRLTEAGKRAQKLISPLVEKQDEVLSILTSQNYRLTGKIRLSVPNGIISDILLPMLIEFNSFYPHIDVEIKGAGNVNDVITHKAEIAFITGKPENSDLIILPRGRNLFVPVASPQYLKDHGLITHPEQLRQHKVLVFDGETRGASKYLTNGKERYEISGQQILQMSNIIAIKNYVLHGYGVCVDLPLFLCANELIRKELIPIMAGWTVPLKYTYIACTKNTWNSRLHRLFIEFSREKLQYFFETIEKNALPYWTSNEANEKSFLDEKLT